MNAGPLPLLSGPAAGALAASAPFRYRRRVVPSKVPTTCDQVLMGSTGPSTGGSAPLVVRPRNFTTPASTRSMYWLLTQPFTVFSKIPPFCPAAVGRAQASTETELARSSSGDAGTTTAGPEPEKVAAVSPLWAP